MRLLDNIRPSRARGGGRGLVHVVEHDHEFTGNRGDTLWSGGRVPLDAQGRELDDSSYRTIDPRVFYCRIAGTHHRPSALRDRRFDRGSKLTLCVDAHNAYDGSIVSVWDAGTTLQVGHVPASLSRALAPLLRSGTTLEGEVVHELRLGSPGGERVALHIMIAPVGALKYVIDKPGR